MTEQNWFFHLNPILQSPKLAELKRFIQNERNHKNIYPKRENVFKAFELCPFPETKVVIIGPGPSSSEGEHGLCFSSLQPKRTKTLNIIFNEIYRDLNIQYDFNISQDEMFPTNDLTNWTHQGILLLNRVLTVEEGKAGSHENMGWEIVCEASIRALNTKQIPIVFLLWGEEAKSLRSLIDPKHIILEADYPYHESFYHCKHFSILRDILPEIHKSDERMVVDMTPFFKKTKAINYIREIHPQYAESAEAFIRQYLTIPIWVNPHHRQLYYEEFKNIMSTKPYDEQK